MRKMNGVMTITEAAAALGISVGLVKRGIASGELPIGDHVGDRWIIYRGAVERRLAFGPGPAGSAVDVEEIARAVAGEVMSLMGRRLFEAWRGLQAGESADDGAKAADHAALQRLGGLRR